MKERAVFNATMKKYFSEQVEVSPPPSLVRQPTINISRGKIATIVGSFAASAITFWAAEKFIRDTKTKTSNEVIAQPNKP